MRSACAWRSAMTRCWAKIRRTSFLIRSFKAFLWASQEPCWPAAPSKAAKDACSALSATLPKPGIPRPAADVSVHTRRASSNRFCPAVKASEQVPEAPVATVVAPSLTATSA
eukprot:CAMPEP_0181412902 /NCGR_PEP_ID=MMETSP1110-20121109/8675_1 /TAXON_ID=174948 /ORGANISM="Symbiodinium sp., Strain CCMP421" /LENGTH=111 /DNA_ID=CAMNT_0023535657 /DNA_START=172 /DNA_END=503 /DNA_ORIENTATION=+